MPTIDCSLKDINYLIGKKLSIKAIEELLVYAKAEIEFFDNIDTLRIKFEDTNQPYLWSTEGMARLFRGILNIKTGIGDYTAKPSKDKIIIDKSVQHIRPYIAAFSASGPAITDAFIRQLIQFQEKLCEGYGMKRRKVSIGVYRYKDITFPVTYKTVVPTSIKFIPLGGTKPLNLTEILKLHPTGQSYAWILDNCAMYPLLIDARNAVLSFPPIINSDHLGKIKVGDTDLLVELTGIDLDALHLVCNILAAAFVDRGWCVSSIKTVYDNYVDITPSFKTETIMLEPASVFSSLGINLTSPELVKLLERMRYGTRGKRVIIPSYRGDVMHPIDVIEDVAIAYGYNNIPNKPLQTYTVGESKSTVKFIDACRDVLVGMQFQEILSPILSSKALLYTKMNHPDNGTVELREYKSENYSVLRTWILPLLMDCISQNKHNTTPQCIFETGEVSNRKGKTIIDSNHFAFAMADANVDYTKAKQVVDALMRALDISYSTSPALHPSFTPGRCAEILVQGESFGYVGEIYPGVLDTFEIRTPVVGSEINLTKLFDKKK
ncbi:MAG: phenylalanine--tRNA ligase subunit beta [Nanoarchaeota archaeon]